MVTVEQANTILKDVYLDVFKKEIKKSNAAFAVIPIVNTDIYDGYVKKLCRTESFEDGMDKFVTIETPLKTLKVTVNIPVGAFDEASGSPDSFLNVVEEEIKSAVLKSKSYLEMMFLGDCSEPVATVITVNGTNNFSVNDNRFLKRGFSVDLYDNGVLIAENRIIVDMGVTDDGESTITLSGDAISAATTTTEIYFSKNESEIGTGLAKILSSSTELYGVDRTINGWGNYDEYDQAGTISVSKIFKMIDALKQREDNPSIKIICSEGVKRAWRTYCQDNSVPIAYTPVNGKEAYTLYDYTLMGADYIQKKALYIFDVNNMRFHQGEDWHWVEEDGSVLKLSDDGAYYIGTVQTTMELICYKPYTTAIITGIKEG